MRLKKFLLFGLIAAVLPAFAEEVADRKTATSLKYVTHELDTRQNKFTAEANKAMEYTNTAGDVQKRTVKSDLGSDTSDTSLPMVGGVNTKLATKQDDIAAVNDHTAVTYTGQPGGIGRKGIYQTSGTYAAQSDNLIDAKTFNAALKRGLDSEFLCSENRDPVSGLCWLYTIHNATPDNALLPAGYTELEFIESNRTQYIQDTLDMQITNVVVVDGQYDYTGSNSMFIAGNATPTWQTQWCMRVNNGTSATIHAGASAVRPFNYTNNTRHIWKIDMIEGKGYIDNIQVSSFSGYTQPNQQWAYLGNYFRDAAYGLAKGKTYSIKVYNSGTLVRNMIPAKHGTTVGMYDTVEGRFFTSAVDGTNFAAGPEVSTNNVYIPQNQN